MDRRLVGWRSGRIREGSTDPSEVAVHSGGGIVMGHNSPGVTGSEHVHNNNCIFCTFSSTKETIHIFQQLMFNFTKKNHLSTFLDLSYRGKSTLVLPIKPYVAPRRGNISWVGLGNVFAPRQGDSYVQKKVRRNLEDKMRESKRTSISPSAWPSPLARGRNPSYRWLENEATEERSLINVVHGCIPSVVLIFSLACFKARISGGTTKPLPG